MLRLARLERLSCESVSTLALLARNYSLFLTIRACRSRDYPSRCESPGVSRSESARHGSAIAAPIRPLRPHMLAGERMERATGVEPATSSLGSWHSTTELHPL